MQKTEQQYTIKNEKELDYIDIALTPGDRIFFVGDLGAGKSTLIRHILRRYMNDQSLIVRSPTYTYYQKYAQVIGKTKVIGNSSILSPVTYHLSPIYHFDLYRLEDYDTFVSIGGEEIARDDQSIMLIEWPEILGDTVRYTQKISIKVMEDESREIVVEKIAK